MNLIGFNKKISNFLSQIDTHKIKNQLNIIKYQGDQKKKIKSKQVIYPINNQSNIKCEIKK